ncbi:MAG: tRNA1(Val) (adenine(37)-N6)-methyltransferase [Deltaproteobacteria bacterium]|nr:tRNA1(Val) (adenine(37)-N6)-methyltransferase [Deltaproteobacteria bacterium]
MNDDPQNASALLKDGETIEDALGGKLRIIQKTTGYRYSLDAFLLVHFVSLKKNSHVLDLGAGSGVIALTLAARSISVKAVGIEIQEDLADMARRSVEMNGLGDRVEMICGDVKKIPGLCEEHVFDAAVMNPPYRKLQSGRINPDVQKALARHEIKGALADFLKAASFALKKSGRVYIIYPATRLVHLMSLMRACRLEPKKLRIVYSGRETDGELALVEGLKEGREELKVLPPLYVYEENGVYTKQMDAIFEDLSRPLFL